MNLVKKPMKWTKDQLDKGVTFLDILKDDLTNLKVGLQGQQINAIRALDNNPHVQFTLNGGRREYFYLPTTIVFDLL